MRSCTWQAEKQQWKLIITCLSDIGTPTTLSMFARFVITASGPLQVPAYPANMGVSNRGACNFQGPSFHTANWDWTIDLSGKRVGVVGTGASAIQLIPAIADKVRSLHVFQRTPPWVLYKTDFRIPRFFKTILRNVPFTMSALRTALYWLIESRFMTLIAGSFLNKWLKYDLERFLQSKIKDDDLRKRLTPNFDPACKRLLFHSTYYDTFNKSHVKLISDDIIAVTEKGIDVMREGKSETVELDVIVFSTGFHIDRSTNAPTSEVDIAKEFTGPKLDPINAYQLDIIGKDGFTSAQWSKEGPRAFFGVASPHFPNMFFLLGPNTTLAHNSVIFMAECQVNYIVKLLCKMRKEKKQCVSVKSQVMTSYYEWIRKDMANKVWHNCTSWYRASVEVKNKVSIVSKDTQRKGDILALWPSTTCWFWLKTYFPSLEDYDVN